MKRGAVLGVALLLAAAGCSPPRHRTESHRALIHEGMTREEVRDILGDPVEVFPVPAQAEGGNLSVELWRYSYRYLGSKAYPLLYDEYRAHRFEVGFNREGRVTQLTPVVRDR